jgi:ATP-dependent RNA helicase RhlE
VLLHIIQENNWSQVLVFTRTKFGANNVAEYLTKNGVSAMALHGNKSQSARTQALAGFKTGELRALVATDIAARGIDIDELPHVVNYEIPNVPKTTCTASAVPAAPAAKAMPSAWSAWTKKAS